MLEIQCHRCATRFQLPDHWGGRRGKCPKCGCVLSIPQVAAGGGRQAETRGPSQPRRWPIFVGAGAAVLLVGVVVLGLRNGGHPAEPGGPVVDAGNDRRPSPLPGDRGPHPPPSRPGPAEPRESGAAAPFEPGRYADPLPEELPSPVAQGASLGGASGRYDDRHCRRIQADHGVRIPPAAAIIEVDGRRLPIVHPARLAEGRDAWLFLPRGDHLVRFRSNEPIQVTVRSDFFPAYRQMRRFFGVGGAVRGEALMDRGAQAMDNHGAPFLLNFWGALHAAEDRWDVAERKFRRSLHVNPAFSPAHLNLAECLLRRQQRDRAAAEVELADAFNVGNVFGLASAIVQFRRRLGISLQPGEPIDAEGIVYVNEETLSGEDRHITALMEGISKYAVGDAQRGKILNNLAVHFADAGRPELALHHFRHALEAIKLAEPNQRYALTRRVFSNMSDVCRRAGFAEADEYREMQQRVKP